MFGFKIGKGHRTSNDIKTKEMLHCIMIKMLKVYKVFDGYKEKVIKMKMLKWINLSCCQSCGTCPICLLIVGVTPIHHLGRLILPILRIYGLDNGKLIFHSSWAPWGILHLRWCSMMGSMRSIGPRVLARVCVHCNFYNELCYIYTRKRWATDIKV